MSANVIGARIAPRIKSHRRSRLARRIRAVLLRFYKRALREPSPVVDHVRFRLL